MKRRSLAFLLAFSMICGNTATAMAANSDVDSEIVIESLDSGEIEADDAEDIEIVLEDEEENTDSDSDSIVIIEENEEEEAKETDEIESTMASAKEDTELPPLTYMDIDMGPVENPDLLSDAAYNADSDYTAAYYVTPVLPKLRNQNPYGSCWAHSSIALAEINLIKKGASADIDFSELQLAYFTYNSVVDPLGGTKGDENGIPEGGEDFLERGGNLAFSQNVFASWTGAASEENYPYNSAPSALANGMDASAAFDDEAHLVNYYNVSMVKYKENGDNTSFENSIAAVKKLIVDQGAAGISYNHSNSKYNSTYNSYYYSTLARTNHAVTIVGWDDNFDKTHFNVHAPGNGAWLIRNSWMEGNSNEFTSSEASLYGYFWISYYDNSLADKAFAFDFEEGNNYHHNYQYDGAMFGYAYAYGNKAANIFTAHGNDSGDGAENLKAVSFATPDANLSYKVEVYTNLTDDNDPTSGQLEATKEGETEYEGYYTVELDNSIGLEAGTKFSVVISFSKDGVASQFFVAEYTWEDWAFAKASAEAGQSFVYKNKNWVDFGASNNANLRIKAFTDNTGALVPTGVKFGESTYDLYVDGVVKPVIYISPSSATNKNYTLQSSNPNVVKIVDGKKIQGVGKGTATITAVTESGNITATAQVKVSIKYSINITGEQSIVCGKTVKYSATITPANAVSENEIVFSSDDPSIITINSKTGEAKAVGIGITRITATAGEKKSSISVSCNLEYPSLSYKADDDYRITIGWNAVEGAERYSISKTVDGQNYTVLNGNVLPGSDGRYSYVDSSYVGKTLSENRKSVEYKISVYAGGIERRASYAYVYLYKNYKINYVLNGGTNNPDNPTYFYLNSWVYLNSPTAPKGYAFDGWYEDAAFTKQINGAFFPQESKDITVYAKYSPIEYYIDFDANGGYGFTQAVAAKYDTPATLTANGFFRDGYKFVCWNTKPDGSGVSYADKATVKNLLNDEIYNYNYFTLYAIWAEEDKELIPVESISFDVSEAVLDLDDYNKLYFDAKEHLVLKGKDGKTPSNKSVKWESSNSGIASVNDSGFITGVSTNGAESATATITATTQDGSNKKATLKVVVKKRIKQGYDGITVKTAGDKKYMIPGDSVLMTVSFTKDGKTVTPDDPSVVWSIVSGGEYAYVSDSGIVTASKEGIIRVRATGVDNSSAYGDYEFGIYVPVGSATISDKEVTIVPTKSYQAGVTIVPAVTGANAGNTATGRTIGSDVSKEVTWALKNQTDSAYVTVDAETGVITAIKDTSKAVVVTASFRPFNADKDTVLSMNVNVKSESLKSISLSSTSLKMSVGATSTITAKLTPAAPLEDGIVWSVTSGEECIKYTENGNRIDITAVKPTSSGKPVKITATTVGRDDSGHKLSASCSITIGSAPNNIVLSGVPKNNELLKGKTATIKAKVFTSANVRAGNQKVTFTSLNPNVATVTSKGKVKAVGNGTATILVSSQENPDAVTSVDINVYTKVTKLKLDRTKVTINLRDSQAGQYEIIRPVLNPTDVTASKAVITWTVNDPSKIEWGVVPADGSEDIDFTQATKAGITTENGESIAIRGLSYGAVKLTATEPGKKKATSTITIKTYATGLDLKENKALTKTADGQYEAELKAKKTLTVKPLISLYGAPYSTKKPYTTARKYATSLKVTYSSSDESVVKVSNSGKITAKAAGTATVYVKTVDGNIVNTIDITVE